MEKGMMDMQATPCKETERSSEGRKAAKAKDKGKGPSGEPATKDRDKPHKDFSHLRLCWKNTGQALKGVDQASIGNGRQPANPASDVEGTTTSVSTATAKRTSMARSYPLHPNSRLQYQNQSVQQRNDQPKTRNRRTQRNPELPRKQRLRQPKELGRFGPLKNQTPMPRCRIFRQVTLTSRG